MFVTAFMNGATMHIVENVATKSGLTAWEDIKTWYKLSMVSKTIIDHYRRSLDKLSLEEGVKASAYVNSFIIFSNKLEAKKEGYTTERV